MTKIKESDSFKSYIDTLKVNTPIFAKQNGKNVGMVVRDFDGWILKIGGWSGYNGHFKNRSELISICSEHFKFNID